MSPRVVSKAVVGGLTRSVDLALARTHLRLGSLTLARAELEALAGIGRLDTDGTMDLAEARWRTDDLVGADAAANEVLATDEPRPLALLIAAEAAAVDGRPGEARRLASRAIELAGGSIDALFAGMPRAGVWPTDAAEPAPIAGTLFHRETGNGSALTPTDERAQATAGFEGMPLAVVAAPHGPEVDDATTTTLTLWGGDAGSEIEAASLPEPTEELQAARAALANGALDEAALRFSLALRAAPALAPAILEATGGARSAALILVRGDAYRSLGHEMESRQAYAVAAGGGLPDRRQHPRVPAAAAAVESEQAADPAAAIEADPQGAPPA